MSPDGVTFLDHTADVGIDVEAPALDALLERAALGMLALLRGEDDGEPGVDVGAPRHPGADASSPTETAVVTLEADGAPPLLAAWLREILFLHETRRLDFAGARFEALTEERVVATLELAPARPPVREIKGVTYHELDARRSTGGWRARVIFDV